MTLYRLFIKGVPVVIFKFKRVFKIAVSSTGLKKLNREVRNSKRALEWNMYASRVVPLKKIAPFTAVSVFIEDEGKENHMYKYGKLIDFFVENFDYALAAPTASADDIINNQIGNLGIDLTKNHPVYSRLKRTLDSDYLAFQLPLTPMHGDISSRNLVIDDEILRLIDFELALHTGSILYDWWCLKKRINKEHNDKTETFNAFIENALEKLGLSNDQFDAFGYAMFSLTSISGFESNKFKDTKKTNKYIDRLNKIIASHENFILLPIYWITGIGSFI